jgi:hypothetical protein
MSLPRLSEAEEVPNKESPEEDVEVLGLSTLAASFESGTIEGLSRGSMGMLS